ncbi:hypothetical protein K435DRAFT_819914 [Dendrothele bispora CBS 962.96]|uniref:CxC1-like cysteine cluster associated with KDZ transposases domain-containing protein n=1 Tax=Dendrothele bispora (strain CBS 962.96) TaxID=1314807 RepID=A0A4S8LYH7_DENBC|nr:hypothetical protein K435DRAFT_819914 [Dendrothele bispora CBS 962.96]
MELIRTTNNLRDVCRLNLEPGRCNCCRNVRELSVKIVRFDKYESVRLWASDCRPAAVQLISSGLFPCAPVYPTLAVDIRMLDFVTRLFLRISPNHTAWCGAVDDYLRCQGYNLEGKDPLRRRFGNSLQWFNSLQASCEAWITSLLNNTRQVLRDETEQETEDESGKGRRRVSVEEIQDEDSPPTDSRCPEDSGVEDTERNGSRKRRRSDNPETRPSYARSRPSEYLRRRCPICFGGEFDSKKDRLSWSDVIVCLDACFTQRHNTQPRDPARQHPDSFFIPQSEVEAVEARVDEARSQAGHATKKSKSSGDHDTEDDHLEDGMLLSKAVLDLCGNSFKAAHEFLAKVIPKGCDVTAVMALLCRHDRPLWVVNMSTPGERQHYAIALLEKLFEHLPPFMHVGVLYDIGGPHFAMSVFHAFGHQWACQVIYHPRKCEGFGLSDGEGAERLWHGIQHLIAYTRITGYHLRIYTLDAQFHFLNGENLLKMGTWVQRKYKSLCAKRAENQIELAESRKPLSLLREQWRLQVQTQTRPLPSQSKNKGKMVVEECMRLRRLQKALDKRVKLLQDIIANPDAMDYEVATAEVDLPRVLEDYRKTTDKLRRKENALGTTEKKQIHHLANSPYVNKAMNARALKTRLCERVRSRKFELDRVEHSCRKQRSEQQLNEHTEDSVRRRDPGIQQLAQKYNKLVKDMKDLIVLKKAPRNAIAPAPINVSELFKLNVDDELWQDIGLNYDEVDVEQKPPPWLADEREEEERLAVERRAMQSWLKEEWDVVKSTMDDTDDPNVLHQLELRCKHLCRLCVLWVDGLKDFEKEWVKEWGPSVEELEAVRDFEKSAALEIIEYEGGDTAFEREIDPVLTEQLETVALSDEYRRSRVDFIDEDLVVEL